MYRDRDIKKFYMATLSAFLKCILFWVNKKFTEKKICYKNWNIICFPTKSPPKKQKNCLILLHVECVKSCMRDATMH